jgi:hypothetical protein
VGSALTQKVLVPLVLSPTIGFIVAFFVMVALVWIFRRTRPATVHRTSRRLQLLSACLMAFSHGSNDAQKSMGIITLALVSFVAAGHSDSLPAWMLPKGDGVPRWVIIACAAAIAAGTAAGGKKIIKTMGTKIIRISPLQGFAAETSGALTILGASALGIPVSTTHVINSCIMGVGASKRASAVRWGVAGNILVAWTKTATVTSTSTNTSDGLDGLLRLPMRERAVHQRRARVRQHRALRRRPPTRRPYNAACPSTNTTSTGTGGGACDPFFEFTCNSGECLPIFFVCDGGLLDCGDGSDEDAALCGSGGGAPPEWTCDPTYYDAADGCDCGCGAIDLDCASSNVDACDYCDNSGSCSATACPGDVDPTNNAICP